MLRDSNPDQVRAGAAAGGCDFCARYSDGDMPVCFEKNREKYAGSAKPRAKQISDIVRLEYSSMRLASRAARSSSIWLGERPAIVWHALRKELVLEAREEA